MMLSGQTEPSSAELMLRLRQQELVADFGRFSLRHDDLQTILTEACSVAADGLATRFAKVLRFDPARGDFLVVAGLGWQPGVVGQARLGGDLESPAGYAFASGQPVLCNHLGQEMRFRTPALLEQHGVHSAINVLVGDSEGTQYGVLEVDSTQRDKFTQPDTAFLQSLANTVAEAVHKQARLDAVNRSRELGSALLEVSADGVAILSEDGIVLTVNPRLMALMELEAAGDPLGQSWPALWPIEAGMAAAVAGARDGHPMQFQFRAPTRLGAPRSWHVRISAMPRLGRGRQRLVAVVRDITEAVAAAEAKDALLREKDLLIQETHHRVKNSLQMVQNLLSLQARAAGEPATALVLRESATRVHTIGAIHDRLYREGSAVEVAIRPYLQGLIDDIWEALASEGRPVTLDAEEATWPAGAVPALGLVTTELVTNALKYGSGTIRLTFRQPPDAQGSLTVEDDGADLPEKFDPAAGRGLGMRIVLGLLRPRGGALSVLRDRPHTCFHAVFPRSM